MPSNLATQISLISQNGQTVPTASETSITFVTVEKDSNTEYNLVSNTITIKSAGRYLVTCAIPCVFLGVANTNIRPVLNTVVDTAHNFYKEVAGAGSTTLHYYFPLDLAVNDTVQMSILQDSGSDCTLSPGYLTVTRMSDYNFEL